MKKLLNKLDLKNGKVIYNDFDISPQSSFDEQKWNYKEDLLQIQFGNYLVDVGWYPEFDSKGNFTIKVINNFDWINPIFDKKCTNISTLIEYLQQAINAAKIASSKC